MCLDDVINKPYSKVIIELKDNYKINEIKEILSIGGDTEINLVVKKDNIKAYYNLENNRKFELKHLKALKAKEYVEKITVQSIDFLICFYISVYDFAHSYKGVALPVQNLELLWWINRKNMNVPKVDIKQLLEAGVHLGHKTLRWNPKMKKYIFGEKNSIHIIDLTQTVEFIKNALV